MRSFTFLAILLLCFSPLLLPLTCHASDENANLEATFNELCGRTDQAEALTVEELTTMIAECDSLEKKITHSSHPKKKILLFRLKKCRNFLHFMIQTKQLESSKQ